MLYFFLFFLFAVIGDDRRVGVYTKHFLKIMFLFSLKSSSMWYCVKIFNHFDFFLSRVDCFGPPSFHIVVIFCHCSVLYRCHLFHRLQSMA